MKSLQYLIVSTGLVWSVSSWSQIIINPTGSQDSGTNSYEEELLNSSSDLPAETPSEDPTQIKKKKATQAGSKKTTPIKTYDNWDQENSKMWSGPRVDKQDELIIGFDVRYYKYEEPGVVTHMGPMFGVWGHYRFAFNSGDLDLQSSVLYGQLKYDGSVCDASNICTPTQVDNTDLFSKSKATWGFNPFNKNSKFIFKVGLGYRYLSDRYEAAGFYTRIGMWGFVPLGAEYEYRMSPNSKLRFNLEYQHIVFGRHKSYLSELNAANPDLEFSQSGYGIDLSLGFIYKKNYYIGAYFDGWYMGDTEPITAQLVGFTEQAYFEPANNSTSFGLRIGYDFF